MNLKYSGRRKFLKGGAVITALAVGGLRSASGQTSRGAQKNEADTRDLRSYGERSRFVTSLRRVLSTGVFTPLQDSEGIITPSALHFVSAHGYDPPDIDPRQHRLLMHGMVDRPLEFTLDDLQRLPSISRVYFLECPGNSGTVPWTENAEHTVQQLHGKTSCSEWTGVPLSLLLQEAGVQKGANWLVAEGADAGKYSMRIPLGEKGIDDVLVAYGQNGEPVRPDNGYPLRLILPGCDATHSVKWLRQIKIISLPPNLTRQGPTGGPRMRPDAHRRLFPFEMGPKSVITNPSGGHRLPSRGFYEITGLAWSGAGVIRKVEVSTDGGRTWKNAQLQEPVLSMAHTRFRFPWIWDGEEAVLQSRCADEQGQVQPTVAELVRSEAQAGELRWRSGVPAPTVAQLSRGESVNLKDWRSGQFMNYIQPWRVSRDGSVHNALFI